MSFIKKCIPLILFLFNSFVSSGGIKVELDEKASIIFPSAPEFLDTLGQKSISVSDATGYYACIVIKNLVKDPSNFNAQQFYQQMFERMQDPSHACQMIKQSGINHTDIIGVEYYSTCRELPDFPEIRYKRFFVYKNDFYVLDYWTNKTLLANAPSFKSAFFNSLVFKKDQNAVIPSAFEPTNTQNKDSDKSNKTILFIAIPFLLLIGLYFFQKKSVKK